MADTLTNGQFTRVLLKMLGSDRPSAARDMSLATFCDATIGRGDDARLIMLPDLIKPSLVQVLGGLLRNLGGVV